MKSISRPRIARQIPPESAPEQAVEFRIPPLVRGSEHAYRVELLRRIRRAIGDAYDRGEIDVAQSIEASRALGSLAAP